MIRALLSVCAWSAAAVAAWSWAWTEAEDDLLDHGVLGPVTPGQWASMAAQFLTAAAAGRAADRFVRKVASR